jgi:ribonuclease T1
MARWLAAALLCLAPSLICAAGIRSAELPPEARETLALIRAGGPFPYARDGAVFGNRERLLPKRERGYYREYTVKTPGARDRGARRIIAGRGGEYYYTDDHYRSFKVIRE